MRLGGGDDGGFRGSGIRNVADDRDALDLRGEAFRKLCVEVAYRDLRALLPPAGGR